MENTENKFSMKWYKFLTYFGLFLSALIYVGTAGNYMSGNQYQGNAENVYFMFPAMKSLDMATGVYYIAIAVVCVIIRQKLAKYKKDGPKWYLTMLGVNLVFGVAYLIAGSAITGIQLLDSAAVPNLVLDVALLFANKTYFDKRKELFVNE